MFKQFERNHYTGFWYKGEKPHPTRVFTGDWKPTYYRFVYLDNKGKVVEEREEATSQYLVVSNMAAVYWWQADCVIELEPVAQGCNIKHSEAFCAPCTAWKHVKSFRT